MRRLAIAISTVLVLSLMVATPALAVAPTNDTYAGRSTIDGLPFTASIDTSEATTDADDVEWNTYCGAPGTDASVWYEYTAVEDGWLQLDLSADFSKGAVILTGSPGGFTPLECYPYTPILFPVFGGATYLIVTFDLQQDDGGNGGLLSLSLDAATIDTEPPIVDVTIDQAASFDAQTGTATVTGTVTCEKADSVYIEVLVQQRVGRFLISGYGVTETWCGDTHAWAIEVIGGNGLFKGGSAELSLYASACNDFDCTSQLFETTTRLRR